MQVVYHPRTEWTQRLPDNNSGSIRPLMQKNRLYITGHYTGVPWHLANGSLRYPPVITPDVMVQFEAIADAGKKSFEYNYVIPVGLNGVAHIWEYAGLYQAAHSFGENDLAFGVIFLLGVDNYGKPNQVWQPISEEMKYAFRWIRTKLLKDGYLAQSHFCLPHRMMPEANTICPGEPAFLAWNEMSQLIPDEEPQIPQPIPIGDDVLRRISKPTWAGANPNLPHLALFDSGTVRPMVSNDLEPQEMSPNETDGKYPIYDSGQYQRLAAWAGIPTAGAI